MKLLNKSEIGFSRPLVILESCLPLAACWAAVSSRCDFPLKQGFLRQVFSESSKAFRENLLDVGWEERDLIN